MKQLRSLARQLGCTVEDDRANTTLYVHAPEGFGWEQGELTSLVHAYGSCGSYLPSWRAEALAEAIERLTDYGKPKHPCSQTIHA